MATEAASLFVSVNADVDKAVKNLGRVNDASQKTDGFLKGAAKQAVGFGTAMIGLQVGSTIFSTITDGAIGMNATLETSTLQFETLMGDADKAKEHVKGLFDFAAKTPFETGPIIEASRLLETFGGAALNTKDNLTTFGDAAAATGQPINEVAFWMSRAYAAIQAGKPWGEAAQRLGEMGIVTPQVRSKLEDLQASGASGAAVWSSLTGELGKFDGAMEKQSKTFDGMMATFTDNLGMFLATALFPVFEGLKALLGGLNDLMASPAFSGAMETAANAIGAAFDFVGQGIRFLLDVLSPVIDAFTSIFEVVKSGDDVVSGLSETLVNLVEQFTALGTKVQDFIFNAIETVLAQVPAFADAFFQMANQAIQVFIDSAPAMLDSVMGLIQRALDWVLTTGVPMAADALGKFAVKFIDWIGPAAEKLASALPPLIGKVIDFIANNAPKILAKLAEWGVAFLGWVAKNVLPRLPGVLLTIGRAVLTFIGQLAGNLVREINVLGVNFLTAFSNFLRQLPGKFVSFLGQVIGAMPGIGRQLLAAAGRIGGDFVRGIINGLAGLAGALGRAIRRAFNAIFPIRIGPITITPGGISVDMPNIQLPSFAVGAWNLPNDMVAQVHKGEMIVPADIAERLRGGAGFGSRERGGAMKATGGNTYVNINIGSYQGSQEWLDRLSEEFAQQLRSTAPRRTSTAGSR